MRLFIAIEMPEEIKGILRGCQKQIDGKIKPVEVFHLTLKFLGEVPENKVEEITRQLNSVKFKRFATSLSKLGVFPNEKLVRVLWVDVDPKGCVIELQKSIEQVLDFPKDKRFYPHMTIARTNFIPDTKEFVERIKKIKLEKKQFEVDEFKLIKSTLTAKGPIYNDVCVFKSN